MNELYKPPNAVLPDCLVAGGKLTGAKKLKSMESQMGFWGAKRRRTVGVTCECECESIYLKVFFGLERGGARIRIFSEAGIGIRQSPQLSKSEFGNSTQVRVCYVWCIFHVSGAAILGGWAVRAC